MSITYEILGTDNIDILKDLCNDLIAFQKNKAHIIPEWFDDISFETRLVPSVSSA
jgi:predicted FMN-binding regulatory protein PaiB